ncbi:MAG TPA: hypothetical protein VGF24_02610 [Vicinamibacterales bacterium]|jgi:hypothetical protein
MAEHVCPSCGSTGRYLPEPSKHAMVNYYRCPDCYHVWALYKDNPDMPHRDVTPLPKAKK